MAVVQRGHASRTNVMWLAVGLALLAAVSYLLIGFHVLGVGDLATSEAPAGIIYVAAAGYVLGGLLILLQRRWLWIVGLLINSLVMLMFFSAYADRSSVLFSSGGLVSKVAEILLELTLIFLIVSDFREAQVAERR